jgi:hypothetical protein
MTQWQRRGWLKRLMKWLLLRLQSFTAWKIKNQFYQSLKANNNVSAFQPSMRATIQQKVNANDSQIIGSVSDGSIAAQTINFYRYDNENPEIKFPPYFNCPNNIPRSKALKFFGRDNEILEIHERLKIEQFIFITNTKGKIGVGKTELARQYAWKYLEYYYSGGVIWIDCKKEVVEKQILEFFNGQVIPHMEAQYYGFGFPEHTDIHQKIDMCWRLWPEEEKRVLIVVDAATTHDGLLDLLPLYDERFQILATTDAYLDSPFRRMELDTLYPQDSISLLHGLVENHFSGSPDTPYLKQVCELVGHSPKALYLIAPFLNPRKIS